MNPNEFPEDPGAEEMVGAEVAPEPTEEDLFKANGFTPQEAAKEMGGVAAGWTGKRLRRYIRDGSCPARKIGGRWYVTLEGLETLLTKLEQMELAKAAKEAAEEAARAEAEIEAEMEAPVEG